MYTSMYSLFLDTRVGYSRCVESRGVWRLSGSGCGAFGDAIVRVNAATTLYYIIGGLNGWTACAIYAATSINSILHNELRMCADYRRQCIVRGFRGLRV